uniref:Major facilitator superfamily transporter n=2 Tax=Colletotrichum gloeosporioides species complex TaxID=2707338 RepID=L2FN73_COLFN
MEKAGSAFPSPLGTSVSQTNFLHPPTPDAMDSSASAASFDRKRDEFNDTIHLTSNAPPGAKGGKAGGSSFLWWTWALWLVGAATGLYSTGSAKALMKQSFFVASPQNSILLLRVLTELCAVVLAALVVVVVEDLQWALASRPGGVSLLHFVGLDSGTGVWGLLRLLATADWKEKYSSLFRLLVICSIPLPGIILMGAISIEMVTFPEKTYPVSAGIGPFNASNVYHVRNSTATALLVQMGSPAWSDRDSFSLDPLTKGVGKCTGPDGNWAPCDESHLLTGGVVAIAPQTDDLKQLPGSASYVVPKTRVVQLEYGKVPDLENLRKTGKCFLLGAASAASYWCAKTGDNNALLFGSAYCPISMQATSSCINDTTWTSKLEISSSLFVYSRLATITYDRGNFSILAVTDMTPAKQDIITLDDYMLSLSAVVPGFNASSSQDATKGDNSALAIYAVTALPINDSEVAKKQSLKAIRKAMSVPFHYFHANYFSNGPSIWELTGPREGLPADMYTDLSISVLSHQVVAGKVSRVLFVLVSSTILCLSAAIIVATSRPAPAGWDQERQDGTGGPGAGPGGPGAGGHTLPQSLTQLGQKPKPFDVAKNIKNDRLRKSGSSDTGEPRAVNGKAADPIRSRLDNHGVKAEASNAGGNVDARGSPLLPAAKRPVPPWVRCVSRLMYGRGRGLNTGGGAYRRRDKARCTTTTTGPPADADADVPEAGRTKLETTLIVLSLCAALFLAALDVTIITTAVPTIAQEFNSNIGYIWIGSAYLLANAAFVPTWGKISDIWGRKPVLLSAVGVFWVGSLLCGLAVDMAMLIAARAIQGIGGGGIIVLVNICISDLFSMRQRGVYFGVMGMVWAVASAVGPVIGGFYINLPISGVGIIILFFVLKLHNPRTPVVKGLKAIDWIGTVTIIGGTIMFLFGLEFGGVTYPWSSPTVICLIVFGILTIGLFTVNEWKYARYPVIPMHLFSDWSNLAAFATAFCHAFAFISGSYWLLYFQGVQGVSSLLSGVYLLPYVLSLSLMSALAGYVIRKTGNYLYLIIAGMAVATLGFGLFHDLPLQRNFTKIVLYQIVAGLGIGPNFQSPLIAVQTSVEPRDIAAATSTFGFIRQMATSISVVIGGVVFNNEMQNGGAGPGAGGAAVRLERGVERGSGGGVAGRAGADCAGRVSE